jgi:AcrR family transcriptional regulator
VNKNRKKTTTRRRPAASEAGLRKAIMTLAWKQISAEGAPSLSLRAIARALGITAPAIYNYFHRREDLVTALILDAYEAFGASQRAALEAAAPGDLPGRLAILGHAYRAWAVANPERYQLMFGAPYPGYRLPLDVVSPAGSRALAPLVEVLEQARRAGRLAVPDYPEAGADTGVPFAAVSVWTKVHGLVSVELSGQYPPFVRDPAAFYRNQLSALVRSTIEGG